jgi:hypothetical protein
MYIFSFTSETKVHFLPFAFIYYVREPVYYCYFYFCYTERKKPSLPYFKPIMKNYSSYVAKWKMILIINQQKKKNEIKIKPRMYTPVFWGGRTNCNGPFDTHPLNSPTPVLSQRSALSICEFHRLLPLSRILILSRSGLMFGPLGIGFGGTEYDGGGGIMYARDDSSSCVV